MKTNVIYRGDCFEILRDYDFKEKIDLIYLDPPFFTSKYYELIWGDGYERRLFDDRWAGGINQYTRWMKKRLEMCHYALKETGSIYLHCDWHANYKLREVMDDIFGGKNFRNEIIWCYRGAGTPKNDFARRHDTIFRFSKSKKYTFNVDDVREEYAKATKERFEHYIGNVRYGKDFGLQKLHPKGKHPDDWWQIQPIAPSAKARLGYPTQKPEELLEKIIKASSNPTDIVLDPLCGCGTAIAVAQKLKRRWIGIDVSPSACELMANRMRDLGAEPKLINMPTDAKDLKKLPHFEFQNWVCQKLHGRVNPKKVGDRGIDGWDIASNPIQVKQSYKVGSPTVRLFQNDIQDVGMKIGTIVAFSFTKGAVDEVAKARLKKGLNISLVTVNQLLKGEFKLNFGNRKLTSYG